MTRQQFDNAITRLKNAFGSEKYNLEKADVLFTIVEPISLERFEACITQLIATEERAPTPARISDYLKDEIRIAQDAQFEFDKAQSNCSTCGGNGFYIAKTNFAYACWCKLGKYYPRYGKLTHEVIRLDNEEQKRIDANITAGKDQPDFMDLGEGWVANNKYCYHRGRKVFVIRADNPEHPACIIAASIDGRFMKKTLIKHDYKMKASKDEWAD